jgi:hypothetical protein
VFRASSPLFAPVRRRTVSGRSVQIPLKTGIPRRLQSDCNGRSRIQAQERVHRAGRKPRWTVPAVTCTGQATAAPGRGFMAGRDVNTHPHRLPVRRGARAAIAPQEGRWLREGYPAAVLLRLLLVPCERDQRKRPALARGTQRKRWASRAYRRSGREPGGALGSCDEFPRRRGSHPVTR